MKSYGENGIVFYRYRVGISVDRIFFCNKILKEATNT
jgi:hypothetical protein